MIKFDDNNCLIMHAWTMHSDHHVRKHHTSHYHREPYKGHIETKEIKPKAGLHHRKVDTNWDTHHFLIRHK